MQKAQPKISILLPVCNSELHLEECLESLLRQSYTDFEVIAIEDKSKDASLKILRRFARQDRRIKVYANIKRYGLAVCLNRAIRHARGQFVTFMEANDRAHVHKLKRQIEYLLASPKTVAVGAQCRFISDSGRELEKSSFPQEHNAISTSIIPGSSLQYETVMINRRILPKDVIVFKESTYPLLYAEAFMKLLPYGSFANGDQFLYYRRDKVTHTRKQQSKVDHMFGLTRLWVKSVTVYDYRPSLRSLLSPLTSPKPASNS